MQDVASDPKTGILGRSTIHCVSVSERSARIATLLMISFYLPNRSSNECCSVSGIPTRNTSKCTSSFSLSDRIVEECVEFSENPETRRLKYEPEASECVGFSGIDRVRSLFELE